MALARLQGSGKWKQRESGGTWRWGGVLVPSGERIVETAGCPGDPRSCAARTWRPAREERREETPLQLPLGEGRGEVANLLLAILSPVLINSPSKRSSTVNYLCAGHSSRKVKRQCGSRTPTFAVGEDVDIVHPPLY